MKTDFSFVYNGECNGTCSCTLHSWIQCTLRWFAIWGDFRHLVAAEVHVKEVVQNSTVFQAWRVRVLLELQTIRNFMFHVHLSHDFYHLNLYVTLRRFVQSFLKSLRMNSLIRSWSSCVVCCATMSRRFLAYSASPIKGRFQ